MRTGTDVHPGQDDRRFFTAMACAALAVVTFGFATSYYLWPLTRATHYPAGQPISPSLPALVHLHALVFTGWIVLLVVQVGLVATGNVAWHRRLGTAAAALIPVMLIIGVATAIRGARAGWNPGGPYADADAFMFVGIADLTVFGVLAAAGIALRRRPDLHKRLMLYATLGGLMWPAITRLPFVAGRFPLMFGLLAALLLAPAVRDLWRGARVRWITLAIGLSVLATFLLRPLVARSAAWHAIAEWLTR
jgi:hypothetical protein